MKSISNVISNRVQPAWLITNLICLSLGMSALTAVRAEDQSLGTGGMTVTVTGNTRDGVTGGSTGVAVQGSGLSTGEHYYIEGRAEGRAALELHAEDGLRRTLTGQSLSGGIEGRGHVGAMTAERGFSFCPALLGEVRMGGATALQGNNESVANGRLVGQVGPGLCLNDEIFVRLGSHAGVQDSGVPEFTEDALQPTIGASLIVRKDNFRAEGFIRHLPVSGSNQIEALVEAKVSDRVALKARVGVESTGRIPTGPGSREAPVVTASTGVLVAF